MKARRLLRLLALPLLLSACSGSCGGAAGPPAVRSVPSSHQSPAATAPALPAPSVPDVPRTPDGPGHRRLAAGDAHTCFIDRARQLWCWGSNLYGEIGIGTHGWRDREEDMDWENYVVRLPHKVTLPGRVLSVAAGGGTCALVEPGALWCWGDVPSDDAADKPVRRPFPINGRQIAIGGGHACVILEDSTLWCWGANEHGQLARAEPKHRLGRSSWSAFPILQLGNRVAAVAASSATTCAITTDHHLWCWGDNRTGELGVGTTQSHSIKPVRVPLPAVTQVAGGSSHLCAATSTASVWCWGYRGDDRGDGALGDGITPLDNVARTPVQVKQGIQAEQLGLGYGFSLALERARVLVWGSLSLGLQPRRVLGPGSVISPTPDAISYGAVPTLFEPLSNVVEIAAGGFHACALLKDDTVWCWGGGNSYQLGNGDDKHQHIPVRVRFSGKP